MRTLTPSYSLAVKVWWAFTWRAVGLALLGAVLIGIIVGSLGVIIGMSPSNVNMLSGLIGFFFGAWAGIYIMHRLMTKGTKKFRIVVASD